VAALAGSLFARVHGHPLRLARLRPVGLRRRRPAPAKHPAKPPQAAKRAGPPPLDLKALEQQLKETKAIGMLTKLSLKNQVDDLLGQFRDYYAGRLKVPHRQEEKCRSLVSSSNRRTSNKGSST
jgi:hypothetical protein